MTLKVHELYFHACPNKVVRNFEDSKCFHDFQEKLYQALEKPSTLGSFEEPAPPLEVGSRREPLRSLIWYWKKSVKGKTFS